jgi:hypothetical protein
MAGHKPSVQPTPPESQLQDLVADALQTARMAKKYRRSLSGVNFYADKLAKLRSDATVCFANLVDPSAGDLSAVAELIERVFSEGAEFQERAISARELTHQIRTRKWKTAVVPSGGEDGLFPLSLLTKTKRGYLVAVGRQMNGCFTSAWYDACAVMMRRLLETTIIEAFEANKLDAKVKNAQGEFFQLTDLISAALAEPTWNLTRNTKQALPRLRDVGHISAHSRRYTAQLSDITKVSDSARIAIEEFLHLAALL